jgi:hypothetical protein
MIQRFYVAHTGAWFEKPRAGVKAMDARVDEGFTGTILTSFILNCFAPNGKGERDGVIWVWI